MTPALPFGPYHAPASPLPPAQDQGLVPSCAAWAAWLAATYRRAVTASPGASPPNASYVMNLALWEDVAILRGLRRDGASAVDRTHVLDELHSLGSKPRKSGALGVALASVDSVMSYLARSGSVADTFGVTPFCDARPQLSQSGGSILRDWKLSLDPVATWKSPESWRGTIDSDLAGSGSTKPVPVIVKIWTSTSIVKLGSPYIYGGSGAPGPSHYVVVVAKETVNGQTCYRLRNSWGPSWGTAGDFFVKVADLSKVASEVWRLQPASPSTPTPTIPSNFHVTSGSGSNWDPPPSGPGWDPAGALRSAAGSHSFTNGVVPWISDMSGASISVGAKLRASPGGHPHNVPTTLALRAPAVPFVPALADYQVKWSAGPSGGPLMLAETGVPLDLGGPSGWKGIVEFWNRATAAVPPAGTGPDPDETGIFVERASFRMVHPSTPPPTPPASVQVQAEVLLPGQSSSALRRTWNVSVI